MMKRISCWIAIAITLALTACGSLAVQGDVIPAAEATRRQAAAPAPGESQVIDQTPASTEAGQPAVIDTLTSTPAPISQDGWHILGLEAEDVSALAIDPSTPTTLYAGTDGYSGANGGVFKSTDGGASWVNTGLSTSCVQALAIDPTMPTTLYAGALDDLFKSTDGGMSWISISTGLIGSVATLVIDPTTPTILYVETYAAPDGAQIGVFKSTDGGENWAKISAGAFGLVVDPTTPSTLYVETASQGIQRNMLKSTNGGEDWAEIVTDSYFEILAIDPTTPTTLYAGKGDLFKSTDGGVSWVNFGAISPLTQALVVDPVTPTTLYAVTWYDNVNVISSTDGGVFKSTDGGMSWVNIGLTRTLIRPLVIDPVTPTTIYAGTDNGVFVIHQEE
jgi:hypothetical protein